MTETMHETETPETPAGSNGAAPQAPDDESLTADVPEYEITDAADVWDVRLNGYERWLIRLAVDLHAAELAKLQKKNRERGAFNPALEEQLRAINGDRGWGQGIIAKMIHSQRTLDEESGRAAETERREVEALADQIALVVQPRLPFELVKTWGPAERLAASDWAGAAHRAASDNDVTVPDRPQCVTDALAAVWAFTPDPELPLADGRSPTEG